MNIINLEINEYPPSLLEKYISDNPKGYLGRLFLSNRLKIYKTYANDIEKVNYIHHKLGLLSILENLFLKINVIGILIR